MFGKIIKTKSSNLLKQRKEKVYIIEENKKLSAALQIPKISMDCVMLVSVELKKFLNNVCLQPQFRI
jgi:hypothetical protein